MPLKHIALCALIMTVGLGTVGCSEDSTGPGTPPAQPQAWQRKAGGGLSDLGLSIAIDGAGNVFAAGSFQGRATFGSTPLDADSTDIYLAKYNASGTLVWVKQAGGTGTDTGWGLATDGMGNVVMTGYFRATANFGGTLLTSAGGDDIFLAKYDTSGNVLWAYKAGGGSEDRARGVAVDGSGNVIVAGRFEGTATFGHTVLTSAGGEDIVVAKYNSSGGFAWALSAGGTGDDRAWGVSVDAAGNIVVAGLYRGTADFDGTMINSAGLADIFVAKYDASGNVLWVQTAGGMGEEKAQDVAVDRSANVLVTGGFEQSAFFGANMLTSNGGEDVFAAKYSSTGAVLWASSAGGTGLDEGISVATDGSDNVILTGIFDASATFGSDVITSAGSWDIFLAKYTPSGTVSWAQSAGGTLLDQGLDVTTDSSGNIIATGYFQNTASFGSANLTSAGFEDIFILKAKPSGLE
jgi:hypothetical protein